MSRKNISLIFKFKNSVLMGLALLSAITPLFAQASLAREIASFSHSASVRSQVNIGNVVDVSPEQSFNTVPEDDKRLPTPANPEAVGLFINLLARYASDAPNKSELDVKLEQALGTSRRQRGVAQQIVDQFNGIPLAQRQAVFGDLATATAKKHSITRYKKSFRKLTRPSTPHWLIPQDFLDQSDIRLRSPFPVNRLTPDRFTSPSIKGTFKSHPQGIAKGGQFKSGAIELKYTGMFAQEETRWDRSSDSDEISIINSSTTTNSAGELETRTEKVPKNRDYYDDVDKGEYRQEANPPTIWSGPAQDLTLVTVVMEVDEGDPNAYKEQIDLVVKAAAAILKYFGISIPDGVSTFLSKGINWLFGTGNDVISEETSSFTASEMLALAEPGTKASGHGDIRYDFKTRHQGDGADYHAYFKFDGASPPSQPNQPNKPPIIQQPNKDVSVTINEIKGHDLDGRWGTADMYAVISIGGSDEWQSPVVEDEDHIRPDWKFTQTVNRNQRKVPIVIKVYEKDGAFRGKDDHVDINPDQDIKDLHLTYDTQTGQLSGAHVTRQGNRWFVEGKGDGNDRAELMYFTVTHRNAR